MLPRWLTALPRFAATWRDEILVVALGLAYQAGVTGTFGTPRHHRDEVVVRIAAKQPRVLAVAESHVTAEARVVTEHGPAPAGCTPCRRRAHAAKVPAVAVVAPTVRVGPMPRVHAVVPVRVRAARVRQVMVGSDAGENVAADVTGELDVAGVVVDTGTLPEVRASIARARAAMDEARLRAAVQKALAAERSLPRAFQAPGA